MSEQFNTYMTYLRKEKNTSDNTLQAYRRDISKFLDYAAENDFDSFEAVTEADMAAYKGSLISSGLSVATVCRSLSALRSMYQYLMSKDIVSHNPAREVHNDKIEKKGPNILSNKEIEALLAQPNVSDIKGLRDKAMLELIYATGIKVTELISLNVDDLNLSIPFVRVASVGKERFIPLYRVAVKALTEYLDKSRKLLILSSDETALFVNAARSAIVDYAALERVLNEEAIGGAIIDVLDTEPPTEADLSIGRCPNVLLTPHICGATYEVTDHQSRILNERIKKWLRGEDMEKIVYNRDVLKK